MRALLQAKERLRFPSLDKPLGPFVIDATHALAKDLAFYIVADGGVIYDVVSGLTFGVASPGVPASSRIGDGIAVDGGTGEIANGPSAYHPLVTDSGDGLGSLSMMLVASVSNTSTVHEFGGVADIPNLRAVGFEFNYTSSFAASAGRAAFDYGDNTNDNIATIAAAADNTPHVYVGTYAKSTQVKMYLDGVLPTQDTTGSTGTKNMNISAAQIVMPSNDNGFGGTQVPGTFFAWAGFNRALDAAEVLELSLNPYGLLLSAEGEMPALYAAGAPAPSVAFRRTRSHLGTRIKSRQVA